MSFKCLGHAQFENYGLLLHHAIFTHSWAVVCGSTACLDCEAIFQTFDRFREHCKDVHSRPLHYQLDDFQLLILKDVMPVMMYSMVIIVAYTI